MTISEVRTRILEILSAAEGKRILLSTLGQDIKVPDGRKLSDFLTEDEELKGKINVYLGIGKDYVTLSQQSAAPSENHAAPSKKEQEMDARILNIIAENLSQDTPRTLQLSKLSTRISAAELGKWTDHLYSWEAGKAIGMHVWAEHHFSEHYIVKSNDGLVWYLEEKDPNSQSAQLYPGEIDWPSPESQDEVNAMHNFAYMGTAGFDERLRRQLSSLSGYTGTDLNRWAAFVAHCIARANFLGEGRYTARSEENGKEYLAISLKGLTTPKNRQIYIVFVQRDACDITPAAPQRWKLDFCAYPGNYGQGKWLKEVLHVPAHDQRQISLGEVTDTLEQIEHQRVANDLVSSLQEAAEAFQAGLFWDCASLISALESEQKGQSTLRNQLYEFNILLMPDESIASIREKLEQDNAPTKQKEDYLQRLLGLIRGNHQVFGEDASDAFCADESFVESLIKGTELTADAARNIGMLVRYHAALSSLEDDNLGEEIANHLNMKFTTLCRNIYSDANEPQLKSICLQYSVTEKEWNDLLLILNSEQDEEEDLSDEAEPQKIFSIDNEARSRVIGAVLESNHPTEEQLIQVFAAPNEFETAIINRDINRMVTLSRDAERFGYDEETISRILDNIDNAADLPGGLTHLYAGNRLAMVIGNAHHQAERCWLSAVRTNEAAYAQLLELYMTENRSADFMAVYTNTPDEMRGEFRFRHHMLKCCYAAEKYQEVLNIARENPEILYHSEAGNENLIMIYDCAVLSSDQELIECCTQIQKHYTNVDQDQLDVAIINHQLQWIMQFTDDPSVMDSLHSPLDETQMAHLRSSLTCHDLPGGDSDFERALRLWMLQKNRNCMAEYYMWRAIKRSQVAAQAEKIVLPLLDELQRDAEMHLFFNAYHKELNSSHICRKYRLRLLCRMVEQATEENRERRIGELCDYARNYLGDTVFSPEFDAITAVCKSHASALYTLLSQLKNAADNPFYAALISGYHAEIQQFSAKKNLLAELGFSPTEIEQIITQIFNGNYPKKQDPLNLAWRIYRFVGIKDGLTEWVSNYLLEYVKASGNMPDEAHLRLLAEICSQKKEWEKLSGLFEHYPQLREKSPALFATLVVRTCQYRTYAEQKDTLHPYLDDRDRHIFDLIAALQNEQCDDEACLRILNLSEEEVLTHPNEMIYLSRWLTEHGAVNSWNTLILGWFMQAMKTYTVEQCAALLSADGLLDHAAMIACQQQWSGTESGVAAAVFVRQHLHGTEMPDLENRYYQELTERYLSNMQDAAIVTQLKILYPERTENIRVQTTLLTLQSSGEASIDPVEMNRLYEYLKDPALSLEEREALSDSLLKITPLPAVLASPAITLWSRLLADKKLAEQTTAEIRAQLRAQKQRPVSPETSAFLAEIYDANGFTAMKDLAAAGKDSLRNKSLFEILTECKSQDEMTCFFADAQMFVTANKADEECLIACAQQEEFCSNADADRILRAFLTAGGALGHQALRNLPLAQSPKQRLWLLEQCALLSHKNDDWRYCINYAETTGQVNIVPRLFSAWLTDAGSKSIELLSVIDHMNSLLQLDSKAVSGDKPELDEYYRTMFPALCAAASQLLSENDGNIKRYQRITTFITRFAVRFGCAGQLVNDDTTLALYLCNRERECSGMRVALLCRLLLAGLVDEARILLRKTRESNVQLNPFIMNEQLARPTKYHSFFMRMENQEDLSDYVKKPEIRVLLERFLPDGYLPTADRFKTELVWPLLLNPDTGKESLWSVTRALNIMHDLNPWDPVVPRAMFYVIKQVYDLETSSGELTCSGEKELMQMLYRSQYGICKSLCEPNTYRDVPRFCGPGTVNVQLSDLLLTAVLFVSEFDQEHWGDAANLAHYEQLRNGIAAANKTAVMPTEDIQKYFNEKLSLLNDLKISSDQERQITKQMILSRITGCWKGLVRYLFRNKIPFRNYDEWCWDVKVGKYSAHYHNVGLLRSLLQVYFELSADQQDAYITWLTESKSKDADAFSKASEILNRVLSKNEKRLIQGLVTYPLEETAAFLGLDFTERCLTNVVDKLNIDANDNDRRSGVGEAWRGLDYKALEQCARWIIDIQNGSKNQIFELAKRSMKLGGRTMDTINAERFNLAYSYFKAANVQDGTYACAILGQVKTPKQTLYHPELAMTTALLRILDHCPDHLPRFFANLTVDWKKKYSLPEGKSWGNDIDGGDSAESIRGFLLQLYPVLSGDNPIGRKQSNHECSAEAHLFVASENDPTRRKIKLELLYHLQNYRSNPDPKKKLQNLVENKPEENRRNFFRVFPSLEAFAEELPTGTERDEFKLTFPRNKWQRLMEQDLLREKFRQLERSAQEQTVKIDHPANKKARDFVTRVLIETDAPDSVTQSMEDLEAEINSLLVGQERRTACAKRYLLEKNKQPRIAKLRLGLEELDYQNSVGQASKLATDTLLELTEDAARFEDSEKNSDIYQKFSEMTLMRELPPMFRKNGSTVSELIIFYVTNYSAFAAIGKLLSDLQDSSDKAEAQDFLEVFEVLRDAQDNLSDETRLDALKKAIKKIRTFHDESGVWKDLYAWLYDKLDNAIAKIEAKPEIKVKILNTAEDPTCTLFGQIRNTGKRTAEDILLTVRFHTEGVVLDQDVFVLKALRQGKIAAFAIPFKSYTEVPELKYDIKVSYHHNGTEYGYSYPKDESTGEVFATFIQRQLPETEISPGFYIHEIGLGEFTTINNGTDVYSENLVGRAKEKDDLRQYFSGTFSNYKNTVIYGFHRTGKTTLLRYLYKYLENCAQDKEKLYLIGPISCQDKKGDIVYHSISTFREALVERVLQQLKNYHPDGFEAAWDDGMTTYKWTKMAQFAARWMPDGLQETADLNSSEILSFYTGLSQLLGKKLIVFLDEFDVLFRDDNHPASLTTLDALMTTYSDSVRFVLCGSNYLCKLMLDGKRTQAFQHVNKRQIDRVSDTELWAFLQHKGRTGQTGANNPTKVSLIFTQEALACIYRLTNGLIYFAGDLMQRVAANLGNAHRKTVYPSDLLDANLITLSLMSESNCGQFAGGCDMNVCSVLAERSVSDETLVRVSDLKKALPRESVANLEPTLQLMQMMGVIERRQTVDGEWPVRFTCELYRRYFRFIINLPETGPVDQIMLNPDRTIVQTKPAGSVTADTF